MPNYKLIIEYDGASFHGWQRQSGRRTVQEEIEKAVFRMTGRKARLIGSGRTDAGVHALGQAANFHCDTRISPEAFRRGITSMMQGEIVIRSCREVPEDFHARYDVKSKIYRYRILNRPVPAAVGRQYAWFISTGLDLSAMQEALRHVTGTHDFKAFEGSGSPRAHTVRNVIRTGLQEENDGYLTIEIEADGFLRYMARNIVGTLACVGSGKIAPDGIKKILASRDRRLAAPTAPPHALFLVEVKY